MKKLIVVLCLLFALCTVALALVTVELHRANHTHDFSAWAIIREASCAEAGERRRICKACKEIEQTAIAATEKHVYQNEACITCGRSRATAGLAYRLAADGSGYFVCGIGEATDSAVVLSAQYKGLPVLGIDADAFAGCKTLTAIFLPEGLLSIDQGAFAFCTALSCVTLPASLTYLGENAFACCTSLMGLAVTAGNGVYHSSGNCIIETASGTLVLGCMQSVIPQDGSVTAIGAGAFRGASGLSGIEIPASVKKIGAYAFWGCNALARVVFFEHLTWEIGVEKERFVPLSEGVMENAYLLRSAYATDEWECIE